MRKCLISTFLGLTVAALITGPAGAQQQGQREGDNVTRGLETAQRGQTTGAKGKWEPAKAFPIPMEESVGAAVNGKLYILQGLTDGGFQPLGVVYVFDPASGEWTKKKDMPLAAHHVMTVVHNGRIYLFGGFSRPGKELAWQPIDNAWEYTPETDSWKALAPLPTRRGAGGAAVVNGKIYVIGGASTLPGASDPAIRFDGQPRDSVLGTNEEYDPATNSWKSGAPMPTARNHFLTASVGDKIYAIGGRLGSTFITRSSNTDVNEEYDVAHDVWRTRAAMPTARSGVAGGVYNGKVRGRRRVPERQDHGGVPRLRGLRSGDQCLGWEPAAHAHPAARIRRRGDRRSLARGRRRHPDGGNSRRGDLHRHPRRVRLHQELDERFHEGCHFRAPQSGEPGIQ